MNKKIRRELEVAFSKHAQPAWFRILKYIILGTFLFIYWGSKWLCPVISLLFALGLTIHFWYRYKTRAGRKTTVDGFTIKTSPDNFLQSNLRWPYSHRYDIAPF